MAAPAPCWYLPCCSPWVCGPGAPITETILRGFNDVYLLYPAVMGIASMVIMIVGYRMKESRVAEMIEEINARKGEGAEVPKA